MRSRVPASVHSPFALAAVAAAARRARRAAADCSCRANRKASGHPRDSCPKQVESKQSAVVHLAVARFAFRRASCRLRCKTTTNHHRMFGYRLGSVSLLKEGLCTLVFILWYLYRGFQTIKRFSRCARMQSTKFKAQSTEKNRIRLFPAG